MDDAIQEERHHWHFRCGVCMTDASTKCAAIAHGEVRYILHGMGQKRNVLCDERVCRCGAMPDESADENFVFARLNTIQGGDSIDVDEDRRLHQPEVHHRHQTLAARYDFGFATGLCENLYSVLDAFRADVAKGGGLHLSSLGNGGAVSPRMPHALPSSRCSLELLVSPWLPD